MNARTAPSTGETCCDSRTAAISVLSMPHPTHPHTRSRHPRVAPGLHLAARQATVHGGAARQGRPRRRRHRQDHCRAPRGGRRHAAGACARAAARGGSGSGWWWWWAHRSHLHRLFYPLGSCAQMGIGGVPDAVLANLGNHKDLGGECTLGVTTSRQSQLSLWALNTHGHVCPPHPSPPQLPRRCSATACCRWCRRASLRAPRRRPRSARSRRRLHWAARTCMTSSTTTRASRCWTARTPTTRR